MQRSFWIATGLSIVVGLSAYTLSRGEPKEPPADNVTNIMRAKLNHSQKIVAALATEDYDAMGRHARELGRLSEAAAWQVIQTSEYQRHSAEFSQAADELSEAAKKKNLDGATLAYVKVTFQCIACHKYVRHVREAQFDEPAWH